jgi:hypothetical protein
MKEINLDKLHIKDVLTIIIVVCSLGWVGFQRLDHKIEKLEFVMNESLKESRQRTDKLYELILEESKKSSKRSDHLYEMFYEVVKEKKKNET